MLAKNKQSGFTIVELLIVIVVIGILAAITIVAYNGISQRARVAAISSDLEGATKQLALDLVTTSVYPATAAAANSGTGLKASTGTTYQYAVDNTTQPQTFCITATNGSTNYYASSASNIPTAGICGQTQLAGWWKFNNNLTDTSSLNNNGSGSVTYGTDKNSITSSALLLNGSQYVQLPSATDIQFPLSVSAWVYPTNITSSGAEGVYVFAADPGMRLSINTSGYPNGNMVIDNSWSGNLVSSIAAPLNQWSNLALVYDGSAAKIYVNGVLGGTTAISGSILTYNPATPYVIGSDNYAYSAYHGNFYGTLDDVRLYSKALTGSEILSVYNSGPQ